MSLQNRGFDSDTAHFQHPGMRELSRRQFSSIAYWLNRHEDFNKLLDEVEQGPDGDMVAWNHALVPMATDLFTPKEMQSIISRYTTEESTSFEQMSPATRRALGQALLTKICQRLKHPQGQQDDNRSGSANGSPSQPQNPAQTRHQQAHSGSNQQQDARRWGSQPSAASSPKPASAPGQPPAEPTLPQKKAPQKWDDLSQQEQESLRDAIQSGQLKLQTGTPPPDAQPVDLASLPQDLQDQLKEQFDNDQDAQSAMQQAMQASNGPGQAQEQGQKQEGQQAQPQGQGVGDEQGESCVEGAENPKEDVGLPEYDIEADPETAKTPNNNEMTGIDKAKGVKATGFGGGGTLMDLTVPIRTYNERMFTVVRDQFERLAAEPDPSDREPEGDEVWNARRIVKAYWRPDIYPIAKQNLARSPENIYFILDTSGSMQEFADVAASLAAGALGLVHLYHGSEAHPQVRIDRSEPLHSPKQFKGLGQTNSSQNYLHVEGGEAQTFVCSDQVPGYRAFRREHSGFEGNLAWWLKQEKPPKGSRLIFWGDTHGVSFENTRMIRRMLRDYRFTWLLPFKVGEEHDNFGDTDEHVLNHHESGYGEYVKLLAAGLQVIGGASSPEGLRVALRKLK